MYSELDNALKECKFFTLKNNGINELSKSEDLKFKKTLKCLERVTQLNEKNRKTIVFRGVTKSYLSERLNQDTEIDLLSAYFYVGEKAQSFLSIDEDVLTKNYLKNIQDCSKETLTFIFNQIKEVLQKKDNSNIDNFSKENIEFASFFENNEPLSFSQYSEQKIGIKIRDYYLYFLHTAGYNLAKPKSFLISTSKEYKRTTPYCRGDYVIVYIVPSPLCEWAVTHLSTLSYEKELEEKGLPLYKRTAIYPDEKEVAIKGGLFQDQILGIKNIQNDNFIVNPHIFESFNAPCSIVRNELKIFDKFNILKNKVDDSNYNFVVFKVGDNYISVDKNKFQVTRKRIE